MWEELYDRCEVQAMSGFDGPTVPALPTPSVLDEFEKTNAIVLPHSYREFVLKFGAGVLAGLYHVASPLDAENSLELAKFSLDYCGTPEEGLMERFGPAEFTERLFAFCGGPGNFFAWKLDEVTSAEFSEYAIYELDSNAELVAQNFQQFVSDYILTADASRRWTPEFKFLQTRVTVPE